MTPIRKKVRQKGLDEIKTKIEKATLQKAEKVGQKSFIDRNISKAEQLVLSTITKPHVFRNNFYNSVGLSSKWLRNKTHSIGMLQANRQGNPVVVLAKKFIRGIQKNDVLIYM